MSTHPPPVHATEAEQRQARLFNEIAHDYEAHYSDQCSVRYRTRFFNEPMLRELDLNGKTVLEAMCGSGQTTGYLLSRGARVTGLDISSELIASFQKRWPDCAGLCASILDTGLPDNSFDCVVVVGGLHHLHPSVDQAVDEIHRVLKPGGHFCFVEPHAGSLPDVARKFWYKRDPLFEANEAAVDVTDLQKKNAHRFEFTVTKYGGNLAYLLVQQSFIFRVPLWLRRLYTWPLMTFEWLISPLVGKRLGCFAVGQWRKKS